MMKQEFPKLKQPGKKTDITIFRYTGITVMKELISMSNEELWELFPIILTEHQKDWERLYKLEEQQLRAIVGKNIVRIRHIGSTAVKDLIAKPTIDILLEIDGKTNIEELIVKIQSTGYIYTHQPESPAPHMMLMKGYTPQGFRGQAYHLHVRYAGDWDEPIFCHYLQSHRLLLMSMES